MLGDKICTAEWIDSEILQSSSYDCVSIRLNGITLMSKLYIYG
jgi:hypothetical protein